MCDHGKNVRSVPGMAFAVGVEQVVGARVVLVDAFLHQAHTEYTGVEIQILLGGSRDGRDVVEATDWRDRHDFVLL